MLAALAFLGRAEAVTQSEQIAFVGVDTLEVEVYLSDLAKSLVTERSLRTKTEFILRSAGVPVDADGHGPWLQVSVLANELTLKDGQGIGYWIYAVTIQLYEVVELRRDDQVRFLPVVIWERSLSIGSGKDLDVRDDLLAYIAEAAEEVSNLYLATR